ncbi:helix-turn-helix transcriptional regulator [Nitrospirillum sp. BR 11752]|uniref:helix-turn-helix transcriptional regulator n=1 Tax=Nitrospirillum sp. BR 11752 TaxID=3104293 RepID=UPI003FA5D39D
MSVYNHFIETRPSEQVTILDCHPHDSGFYIISIQKYNHNNQELYATFIYDPKYHDSINIRKIQIISNIRKIYSLSNSEAEVSYCIYAGMSIDKIAKHRKSSVNTIRTHIKNILSKTGLARQQDIVRLMADISMMPKIQ